MKIFISLFTLCFLCLCSLEAQIKGDSIPSTTIPAKIDTISPTIVSGPMDSIPEDIPQKTIKKHRLRNFFNFKKDYPSPKKAILLTVVMPGLGQIYNKKYWKLPIVYGGVGSMVYLIIRNNKQYQRYKTALIMRDNGECDEFTNCDTEVELLSDNALVTLRRDALKNRELSYIGLAFSYILTGVDAFVDAHLHGFDVSDDLTLEWQPHYQLLPNQESAMSLRFSFQHKSKKRLVYPVRF